MTQVAKKIHKEEIFENPKKGFLSNFFNNVGSMVNFVKKNIFSTKEDKLTFSELSIDYMTLVGKFKNNVYVLKNCDFETEVVPVDFEEKRIQMFMDLDLIMYQLMGFAGHSVDVQTRILNEKYESYFNDYYSEFEQAIDGLFNYFLLNDKRSEIDVIGPVFTDYTDIILANYRRSNIDIDKLKERVSVEPGFPLHNVNGDFYIYKFLLPQNSNISNSIIY